jgi:hypothetical protein
VSTHTSQPHPFTPCRSLGAYSWKSKAAKIVRGKCEWPDAFMDHGGNEAAPLMLPADPAQVRRSGVGGWVVGGGGGGGGVWVGMGATTSTVGGDRMMMRGGG